MLEDLCADIAQLSNLGDHIVLTIDLNDKIK